MSDFFANVQWDQAQRLESLARLSLELREAQKGVLAHYQVADAAALAARIVAGACAEHPAWEHLLALRVLAGTRESVRRMIAAQGRDDGEAPPLHLALEAHVAQAHAADLAAPPSVTQDALTLQLAGGVTLEVHYASPADYALRWHATGADGVRREAGIDTAPVHPALATAPNHLHRADGSVVADPLTRPGAEPAANLRALIDALRANPRFALEG